MEAAIAGRAKFGRMHPIPFAPRLWQQVVRPFETLGLVVVLALSACSDTRRSGGSASNVEQSNAEATPSTEEADQLDDESLVELMLKAERGLGEYCPNRAGAYFAPLAMAGRAGGGTYSPFVSAPMQLLIKRGPAAVGVLLRHLDDKREVATASLPLADNRLVKFRYHEITSEIDPSDLPATDQLVKLIKALPIDLDAAGHQLTVGDLCFFALGQIFNRYYLPCQSVSTFVMAVTSTTRLPGMVDSFRKDWATLDSGQHKALLISDVRAQGSSRFREDALLRLEYYYPKAVDSIAVETIRAERATQGRWHALATLIGTLSGANSDEVAHEVEATVNAIDAAPNGSEYLGLTCVDFLIQQRRGLAAAERYCRAMVQFSPDSGFEERLTRIADAK